MRPALVELMFVLHFGFVYVSGDPTNDPNIYGDPFKTLFVARIVSVILFLMLLRTLSRDYSFLQFSCG